MERRDFLTGAALTGAGLTALGATGETTMSEQEYYEHRTYHLLPGDRRGAIHEYLEKAAIPAWNRHGVGPVGVFTGVYGGEWTTLEVLLTHPNLESVVSASVALGADPEYHKAGAGFVDTPANAPKFVRYESCLMRAFTGMPTLEVPEKKDRIFEIRTYESHSVKFAKKKVQMFNEGGEIAIFRETGLDPVFFGETLVGSRLPNLTYMLVFDDMADHDASWANFIGNDKWKALSGDPQYKDTVSNIHNRILKPTDYSQI